LTRELSGGDEGAGADAALLTTGAASLGRGAGGFASADGGLVTGGFACESAVLRAAAFSALRSASAARMTSVLTGSVLADGVSVAVSIVALDAAGGGGSEAHAASSGPSENRVRYFMVARPT
jgi:hypothetical protein